MKHIKPLIIAHRGVSLSAPENTGPAFQAAVDMGLGGVETDVQLTRDGKTVLHHNYTVDACSNGSGAVYRLEYEQLRALDFGAYRGEQWRGTKIPNLQEFWAIVHSLPIVNIELKAPVDHGIPYVETVLDSLRQFDRTDNVIISAFDHNLLRRVKELCPSIAVGLLTLPAGFDRTPIFRLLENAYPRDKLLLDACAEDLQAIDPEAFDPHKVGLPGKDARDAVAELAHQIGAVYPGLCLPEAGEALHKTADLSAYVDGLDFHPDYLHCHYSAVLKGPALVERMRQRGVKCNVWTPDRREEFKALCASGCHAIITNRPDLLLELEAQL